MTTRICHGPEGRPEIPPRGKWRGKNPIYVAESFQRQLMDALAQNRDLRLQVAELKAEVAKHENTDPALAEILRNKVTRGSFCGIYFLIKEGEIVYVGQSKNVFGRMNGHADKDFDYISFLPCRADELDLMEARYIVKYKPILNVGKVKALPWSIAVSEATQRAAD
jgi:cell division protein FtsB